ncbi:hypothetical protein FRC01_005153 [Tulasnella sp. 417]|nr:hypothetical protein FRC01_005153 [Tulasnella sp. 417]
MLGGPLGISLAPAIKQNKGLLKLLTPIANAYANAMGHRQLGLRYDDLLVEEREDVQKALSRLPAREGYDRAYRLKMSHQLAVLHRPLPKEQWLTAKDDVRYLAPVVEGVKAENDERDHWDTMEVEKKKTRIVLLSHNCIPNWTATADRRKRSFGPSSAHFNRQPPVMSILVPASRQTLTPGGIVFAVVGSNAPRLLAISQARGFHARPLHRSAIPQPPAPSAPLEARSAASFPPLALQQQQRRHVSNTSPKSDGETASTDDKALTKEEQKLPLATRAWAKVKHEAAHYWNGSKLLVAEVRISSRLLLKLMRGGNLTRRENRQLKRTTGDLLRLIPFSVFVVVPFMELLLPVAIKLFPNMLPSTFEDKFAAEEKERKLIQVRLEMAKFLQDTLHESPLKSNAKIVGTEEFKQFFRKVRSTGDPPSTDDIINVAKLFDDDLTLDNLSRPQLVSVCRYMNVNAFGTDNYLRSQIRGRLERIRKDDAVIFEEGISSLSTKELQQAGQSRGIRTIGVSPSRLREELETWIDLHYTNKVSGVLLILSRAFDWVRVSSGDKSEGIIRSLQSVLSTLPDTLLSEAEVEVDDKATYKQKLEVLKQQEELIEDEAEQEEKEEEARRLAKEAEEKARREEEAFVRELLPDSELEEVPLAVAEEIPDAATDARMTAEQLTELGQALAILSAKSTVIQERDELRELVAEYKRENQSETPSRLILKIQSMLDKIDKQIESYDSKVGVSLDHINVDQEGRLTVGDVERALKLIKHAPSDDQIAGICKKLDIDDDGLVVLNDVMDLVKDEGLGVVVDDAEEKLAGVSRELKDDKPRKEDILHSS